MRKPGALPAAVLFDMDGTLVDTEVLWWEATEEVAASLGHRLSDADAPEVVGRAVEDTAAHLMRVSGAGETDGVALSATLTASFHRRVEAGAPLRPGAWRLLAELERRQVPFALVSASPRIVVDTVVGGALADVPFSFTLSADDTVRTKPHPDPYRAAADRFGALPGACVAVEDSPDGSNSAEAAGCAVLVVPSLLPVPESAGRVFARSLEEVDLAVLSRCVSACYAGPDPGTGRPPAA
ncbi:hydrolase [Streptomyces lunaelactis]|uniref:Hydrolase n=1 Tax=Streptomyces lunaelactis TaxID=1535768 RepID=A0A2R4T1A1_9ACTN|nr:HAD family phosphatase [Streptomyces lunaelactis]AVZ72909.1 hydrolase [Streptomyces lunaelactis]NUK05060.1 HAD family phosphatase [Streptomyces lunaelactis]NUK07296.1 HAD family phosphatase [Streptomyces lunaelactis]NUK17492.1 HAD family phosphatase [Streptomyces lunaelactis]NUK24561.1 HAD family phosphatase [Streptomyces lunaelactis]